MNLPNQNQLPEEQNSPLIRSTYSSTPHNTVSLNQQLQYIKDTSKEVISILWNSFRDYIIKQRQNNRYNSD